MSSTRVRVWIVVALPPLLCLAACRFPVAASDFAKECASDDECVVVEVGDTCDFNRCEAGAIHVDELERYRQSQGGLCWQTIMSFAVTTCGSTLAVEEGCIDEGSGACIEGECVVQQRLDEL